MTQAFSSPDHPSSRRNDPMDHAFERIVGQDRLLGSLAARHWLQRDLRLTFLAALGPCAVWLLSGMVMPAMATAIGFGALLALGLWTAAQQGPTEARTLLGVVRWIAVGMVLVGVLVIWNSPSGSPAGTPGTDRTVGTVAGQHPAPGGARSTAP